MPIALREDILSPIAGGNPAGVSLRHTPVYDKIKEAKREDDDAPQGDWVRERKTADFNVVVKLAGDALAEKSKDLQLAAWLTEALLWKDGFNGLHRGLQLIRRLVEEFWDGVYPEIEDGDLEMRAAPLDYVGNYLDRPLRTAPFTRSGLGFYKYKESRAVGYEAQADESSARKEVFEQAKKDGKVSADDFDNASKATPTASYEGWAADLEGSLETLDALNDFCQEKFGDVAPSFSQLRGGIEEIQNLVKGILNKRREAEAPPSPPPDLEPEPEAEPEPQIAQQPVQRPAARAKISGVEPADVSEVVPRLAAIARFLRQNDSNDPAPYLLLRGYRWSETRRQGSSPHPSFLVAPSTETRQTVKRLAGEENWREMLEAAEAAMAEPCGRAWLDLQRYVVKALDAWGSGGIAAAIRSELRALLADIPELPGWALDDDTPAANTETQAWLMELTGAAPVEREREPEPEYAPPPARQVSPDTLENPPDAYEMAMQRMRAGRKNEAIELMAEDVALQSSGRGRFNSKVRFAEMCLATGYENMALPLLEEMLETIEHYQLETWESPETLAHALTLLYRCLDKLKQDDTLKQKIYHRICRLDLRQALTFAKSR